MIETAIKEDLFLDKKLIIPKNKLDAIRIMNELHPVVGGQPTHEKDQPNDNNPILDLACTLANIHASGVGEHADLRPIQNEPPSFFYGEGFISGISSLKGNGILVIFGHWRDGSGNYAIKQFYYTDKEISYRNAISEDQWSEWIDVLTSNSQLDYNKLLNVPITSTLSDDKNKIASIFSVNEVNRKANTAQVTANNADAKAVNAQRTADTSITNAKIADDKAIKAQARADAAFTRIKPIAEGGTNATTVAQARTNFGLKGAALVDLTSTLSDAKDIAASIFSVNEINRKVKTAQTSANNADAKAVAADQKAVIAQAQADAAFTRVKPIIEGGTGATTAENARKNLGHGDASTRNVATTLESNGNTLVPLNMLFGYEQKWVDVTKDRLIKTPYKNNTLQTIFISIDLDNSTSDFGILVDGVKVALNGHYGSYFPVPPGSIYEVEQGRIQLWAEFRKI